MKTIMEKILDNSLAEITVSYSTKIKKSERVKITTSNDANNVLRNIFPSLEHVEYFYIICLDRANQVLGFHQVSKGGLSGTVIDVRVIFQVAIKSNSVGIILAHNHPSGNLQPSDADLRITKKIKEAGTILDITVLDHLILSEESYLSMADESLI